MERFNIFNLIHKGLRAALYQTALELQQTDFTNSEARMAAVEKVREIVMLFDGHAHKEDSFILPAVFQYEPSVSASFEAEHVKDAALGEDLQRWTRTVESADSFLEAILAGRALNESFVRFVIFNLQHMAKEEDLLNTILWRYYNDEEIIAISREITKSVEPWIQDFYMKWMLRGINGLEATGWLTAIEREAPAVVFQTVLQKAKQEYGPAKFRLLEKNMSKELAVA